MVKFLIVKNTILIETPHKVIQKVAESNVDVMLKEVLEKCKDPNIEVVSWFNRYEMIKNNPRTAVEKEISDILSSKAVTFRKYSAKEWNTAKEKVGESMFNAALEKSRKNAENKAEEAADPFV